MKQGRRSQIYRMNAISCFMVLTAQIAVIAQDSPAKPPPDTLPATWNWTAPPLGIGAAPATPESNPLTEAKVRLGRRLFFDPILSKDQSMSCASCHRPDHGFASSDPLAIGVAGQRGERNAPTILNRAYGSTFFWDGRSASLEAQALLPITSPQELANTVETVLDRLRNDAAYSSEFAEAFGASDGESGGEPSGKSPVTAENLAKAIASFERTLVVGDSAVDRFRASQYASLTPRQRQGLWIFESRGKCWQCHAGDNLTDEQYHNTGVGYGKPERDLGRFRATNNAEDRHAMKTPTLRAIAHTAPYMHDGSMATLREVVEFYNRGGSPDDPELDRIIQPLQLSDAELDALVEFLGALSPLEPFAR